MKPLIFLIISCIILSCKTNEPEAANVDMNCSIWVTNVNGDNLLNSQSPKALDISKIKIFYLENGEKKLVYALNTESARQAVVKRFGPNGQYYMDIVLSMSNPSITYIQWSENNEDTLSSTTIRSGNTLASNEVYVNGILKQKNNLSNSQPIWNNIEYGRNVQIIK